MKTLTRFANRWLIALAVVSGAAACGKPPQVMMPPEEMPAAPYEMPTPELIGVAPDRVAVGDRVQVFGTNFVPKEHGDLRLKFNGYYTTESGARVPYVSAIPLKVVNAGLAEFDFGPKIMFSANGEELGSFTGTVSVVNRGLAVEGAADATATELGSNTLDQTMHVKPSIIMDQIRNVEASAHCQEVSSGTVPEQSIAIGFHVVGIGLASESNPFTATVAFESPLVVATFVKDYSFWPPTAPPSGGDTYTTGTSGVSITQMITEGRGINIDPLHVTTGPKFTIAPPVTLNGQQKNSAMLYRLATGKVDGIEAKLTNFTVTVSDYNGNTIVRNVTFKIQNRIEVLPPTSKKLIEQFEPEMVDGPVTGSGTMGTNYSYTWTHSDSKQTALGFSWDQSAQASLGVTLGPFFAQANASGTWGATFGGNGNETQSSDDGTNRNISVTIFPGSYGASYRQALKWERRADLVYHSECGVDTNVGQAVYNDWTWGFDVAMAKTTPPPSKLPPAQKFE